MRILSALVCTAMWASGGSLAAAQGALAAAPIELTAVDASRLPPPRLTLRPGEGLRDLARQVAEVLELRTGQRIEIGSAPPPEVLEAVPAGHVAVALRDGAVLLVLGAAGGRSVETSVELKEQDVASAARAVALAVEALCDEAIELSRQMPAPLAEPAASEAAATDAAGEHADRVAAERATAPGARDDEPRAASSDGDLLTEVEPLVYVRAFAGASTASAQPMTGFGAGLGVCVREHCLFLAGEVPSTLGTPGRTDARYRYTTFLSGFYSRPFHFGPFTPGATLGFFTRVGEFEQDMGLGDGGVETDLGARGSLELSWEMLEGLDLMAEGGVDLTIDRLQLSTGNTLTNRADRWSPWGQLALRYRP